MNFGKKVLNWASKVSTFMYNLHKLDEDRFSKATESGIPHGDLAYGMALEDWIKKGKPKNAWFSYAPGQTECPLLMAFRKEISDEFGLPILTREEAEKMASNFSKVKTKKVYDWGPN